MNRTSEFGEVRAEATGNAVTSPQMYQFEDEAFATVPELVLHHVTKQVRKEETEKFECTCSSNPEELSRLNPLVGEAIINCSFPSQSLWLKEVRAKNVTVLFMISKERRF